MDGYSQSFAEQLHATIVNSRDIRELRQAAMIAGEMLEDQIASMPPELREERIKAGLAETKGEAGEAKKLMRAFYQDMARRYGISDVES